MKSPDIQAKIAEWADRRGYLYNKIVSASRSSWPDCVVVIEGITFWVEVKTGDDKPDPLQARTIAKLNRNDKIAFTVYSISEFKTTIERLLHERNNVANIRSK